MSEKKIELIAQLLAKAESTTPEEAEALTEHAERLMLKYMIDQATIDARRNAQGNKGEEIIQVKVECGGSYRKALMWLTVNVGRAFGNVEFLKSNDNGKKITVWLVGFESDVHQLQTLVNSLQVQGAVALRSWWKDHKDDYQHVRSYEQWEARSSFVEGFGRGAAERIRNSRAEAVQTASTGTDLVLVERGAKVQEYMDSLNTRKGRATKSHYDYTANQAGQAAGRQANTGGRSVGHPKAVSA